MLLELLVSDLALFERARQFRDDSTRSADDLKTLGAILAELYAGPALTEIKGKDLIYAIVFAKYKF